MRKRTVHFPLTKPVPVKLISRIAKLRASGIAAAAKNTLPGREKGRRQVGTLGEGSPGVFSQGRGWCQAAAGAGVTEPSPADLPRLVTGELRPDERRHPSYGGPHGPILWHRFGQAGLKAGCRPEGLHHTEALCHVDHRGSASCQSRLSLASQNVQSPETEACATPSLPMTGHGPVLHGPRNNTGKNGCDALFGDD